MKIDWKPVAQAPMGRRIYVWMPSWWAHGPLVPTAWRGYWENEYGNGSAPPNFQPKWFTEIPDGPDGW